MRWGSSEKERILIALEDVVCAIAVAKDKVIVYGQYDDIIMLIKQIPLPVSPMSRTLKARQLLDAVRGDKSDGFACIFDGKNVERLIECDKRSLVRNLNKVINKLAVREGRKMIRKDLKKKE